MGFYIGKGDTLYFQRENGSLVRFGLRLSPDGLQVFDQQLHRWLLVPSQIPANGKPDVIIEVRETDG